MTKFKGVIFDIDGTLTATNRLIFDSFNHITNKYLQRSYTDAEIVEFFGPTEDVIIRNLMGPDFDSAREDYHKFYEENHKRLAEAYPGIVDLVKNISKNKTLLSVYTGKGRGSTMITLKETGLLSFFDMVVSGDDIEGFKPSAEGITLFLEKFNLSPDDVLMIGDAPNDLIAARGAGCKVASVLWDSYAHHNGFWKESDYAFHTVEELSEFLLKRI